MTAQGYEQSGDRESFPTHPLVAALGGTEVVPGTGRDVVTLLGYLGVTRDGITQLFLDLDFATYLEIPTDAIKVVPPPQLRANDENSPSVVVVDPTARINVVKVSSQAVEASYLKGLISAELLEGAARLAGFAGGVYASPGSLTPQCTKPPVCPAG